MKNRKTPHELAEDCIRAWHEVGDDTDVLGSYTGTFRASGAVSAPVYYPYGSELIYDDLLPVQDADDL